jgi:lipoate-protein ligase B
MTPTEIRAVRLGRTPYAQAWELQRELFRARTEGATGDLLLLTEHDHVYTLGTSGERDHLLAGPEELRERGASVYEIDRGGDVTYHGPGQLVGYPILDLHGYHLDLHRYLRDLEEVVIRTLADYGISAGREPEFTGVWVGSSKIAALGVKASRWVTMHGFALNVNTDLGYFDRIIPCGIFHKGVTSMRQLLGRDVPLDDVSDRLTAHFGSVFGAAMETMPAGELERMTAQILQSTTIERT